MPFIHVSSNVDKASVDADKVARAIAKTLAEALDAPEHLVFVLLSLKQPMLSPYLWSADAYSHCIYMCVWRLQPCAFMDIRSIKVETANKPGAVKAITATVAEVLSVPSKRIFVNLQQIVPTHWGFNGTIAVETRAQE